MSNKMTYGDAQGLKVLAAERMGLNPSCIQIAHDQLNGKPIHPMLSAQLGKAADEIHNQLASDENMVTRANEVIKEIMRGYFDDDLNKVDKASSTQSTREIDDNGYVQGKDGRSYEICTDQLGKRVWINADDGSAVARFNTATGVDIHNTARDQLAGAPECLWCTHSKPDYRTWQEFVKKVNSLFGIELSIDTIDVGSIQGNL